MRTLGIDLATTNSLTGVCEIHWDHGCATIAGQVTSSSASDNELVRRIRSVIDEGGWVGIDAPFGFPVAFSEAVRSWSRTDSVSDRPLAASVSGLAKKGRFDPINRRLTDAHVHERQAEVKKKAMPGGWITWPLSVVVERITPTAIRCARLLTRVSDGPIDRIGSDSHIVETYPVAALRLWGINPRQYKEAGQYGARKAIIRELVAKTGCLDPGTNMRLLLKNHDTIDALVCALVARLASLPHKPSFPRNSRFAGDLADLRVEGWIHVPDGPGLNSLC